MFSPSRPQSICEQSYEVSFPMNTTVGALRNIFLKSGSSAAFGFFCLKISLTPFRNSGLSTTRTAQDCLFWPLGALMPQSKITFIVSRFTASGLYLRMLRRDIIVSITASESLFSVAVLSLSLCTCGPQPDSINRPAPNSINFKLFIFCAILVIRFFANLTKKAAPENGSRLKNM